MKTLLAGGLLVDEQAARERDVLVEDGSIVAVGQDLRGRVEVDEVVDLGGHVVLPGAIDGHVHFEEPGNTDREDFATGTRAAAAGGITTVIDHPLTIPATTTAGIFHEKRALVARHAYVDFGLWAGIIPGSLGEVDALVEAGAAGFKVFLVGSEPDFPRLERRELVEALERVAAAGSRLLVHAEDDTLITARTSALARRRDPRAWAEARPVLAELRSVEVVTREAARTGAHVHFVHLTAASTVDVVRRFADAGHAFRTETCPHYLLLDVRDLARLGPWAKCAPPLRSRAVVERLWSRVLAGDIDFLASDHAPWTRAEKEAGIDDIWAATNGLQSLQFMTVLLLTSAEERGLPLSALVRMLSSNLARWLGWYPRKGTIASGSDADLAVYARIPPRELTAGELFDRQLWTPFEGRRVTWQVVATMSRGEWVYRAGQVSDPPRGRFIPGAPVGG